MFKELLQTPNFRITVVQESDTVELCGALKVRCSLGKPVESGGTIQPEGDRRQVLKDVPGHKLVQRSEAQSSRSEEESELWLQGQRQGEGQRETGMGWRKRDRDRETKTKRGTEKETGTERERDGEGQMQRQKERPGHRERLR